MVPTDHAPDGDARQPGDEGGGETVCWAHLVCPRCGRLAGTEQPEVCEACDADFPE